MKIANQLRITILPLCCLLTGCVFDTPPNVVVQDVSVSALGEGSPAVVELDIDLKLENTTDDPIQLETFDYTLTTAGGDRWSGSWSALRTLPAKETFNMRIPAVIPDPFTSVDTDTSWRVEGTVSYKAPGRWAQILFDTGFRRPTHDFRGRGPAIKAMEADEAPAASSLGAPTPQG